MRRYDRRNCLVLSLGCADKAIWILVLVPISQTAVSRAQLFLLLPLLLLLFLCYIDDATSSVCFRGGYLVSKCLMVTHFAVVITGEYLYTV